MKVHANWSGVCLYATSKGEAELLRRLAQMIGTKADTYYEDGDINLYEGPCSDDPEAPRGTQAALDFLR